MEISINKIAAGVVGLAMVAGLAFAFTATQAHAAELTLSDLVELFIGLGIIDEDKADEARAAVEDSTTAPTAPTGVGAVTCTGTFSRNLTVGDTGTDVKELQQLLNARGFTVAVAGAPGSAGMESEYFGPATKSAVTAMQNAYAAEVLTPLGLTTGTGFFGASTRVKANALCSATTPTVPGDEDEDADEDEDEDTSDLGNDEGSIEAVNSSSQEESNLEEGTEGGVLGFELEIEGDVMINRVDVYAEVIDSTTASDNADDYFTRAFLLMDGEEVAELDVDDFDTDSYSVVTNGATDDEEYRLRFTGLDLVFVDGDEPEFQVGFEIAGTLDSADLAGDWELELDSIRYQDGAGFTDSEDNIGQTETFGFDQEEIAELKISESSSNPEASTIEVDDSDDTQDVDVFVFDIEEKNGLDVTIEDLTVTITTLTADESAVVASAALYDGSDELDSVNVLDGGVAAFENIGLDIDADDEVTLTVKLTFEDTNDGVAYDGGETVDVVFTSIDDAEDANGNDEGDMTISGTPSSETHTLYEAGLVVEVTEAETDVTDVEGAAATNPDNVTFTWELDVTAFGDDDVYVNSDFAGILAASVAADVDTLYTVEVSTGAAITGLSGTITSAADEVTADATAYSAGYATEEFFVIESGTTETITIVVTGVNQTNSKQVQAYLSGIEWTTDDILAATAQDGATATINSYTSELATDSETGFALID